MHDTRQRIVEYLKEKKQATVYELAAIVDLTPMAVRYHLNVLQRDNLVASPTVRRVAGRGRPQQIYPLTEAAAGLFPVDYHGLTDYLLDELNLQLGKAGTGDLFSSIADRLAHEVPPIIENQTIEERLDEVIAFLQEKGFVGDWEVQDDKYMIHAYSCPYRQVVKRHNYVCLLDKQVISSMLNTSPTRVACLTSGDTHCTYQISKQVQLIADPT